MLTCRAASCLRTKGSGGSRAHGISVLKPGGLGQTGMAGHPISKTFWVVTNEPTQRKFWSLPSASGKGFPGPWNVLPGKSVFVYLGPGATLDSLRM